MADMNSLLQENRRKEEGKGQKARLPQKQPLLCVLSVLSRFALLEPEVGLCAAVE